MLIAFSLLLLLRNYMSLIKAAGRDRDVDRAFSIIQRLRENNASRHRSFWPLQPCFTRETRIAHTDITMSNYV